MKNLWAGIVGFIVFLAVAGLVRANEGTVSLRARNGFEGSCFASSIYNDGYYRVNVSCRDLRMAPDPVRNRYILWARSEDRVRNLGEILRGKHSATVSEPFDSLFITLESDDSLGRPSETIVAEGDIESIDFGEREERRDEVEEEPEITPTPTPTPTPTAAPGGAGAVIRGIGRALLFGFILLLIIVGVLSFLSRRRSLG